MLTNCMAMAIEEERILKVKVAKLDQKLQILRLEVREELKYLCSDPFARWGCLVCKRA